MRIQCPNCPAAYELDDGRVPPAGLSIKCPKCKTPFTVHRQKPGEAAPAGHKVPLPGNGAPAAKPSGARTGNTAKQPGAKGAVPLPGTGVPAAPRSGAVPLPGQGDAVVARPPSADPFGAAGAPAVPLPGLDDELPAPSAGGMDFPPPNQTDLDAFASPPPASSSMDDAFPAPDDTALTPKRAVEATDVAPKDAMDESPPPPAAADDSPSFDFVDPGPGNAPPRAPPPQADAPEMLDFVDEQPQKAPATGRAPPPMIAPAAAKKREKKRPEIGRAHV